MVIHVAAGSKANFATKESAASACPQDSSATVNPGVSCQEAYLPTEETPALPISNDQAMPVRTQMPALVWQQPKARADLAFFRVGGQKHQFRLFGYVVC
jgi:hypothetical protein